MIPARAEVLELFKHIETNRAPSKLAPGADQIAVSIVCPRCDRRRPLSAAKFNCAGCELAMEAGPTTLHIWTEETVDAE